MIDDNRRIQSVERAMALLEAIAAAGGESRLVDLTTQLGLNKSTLHGLLNTLAALGYVTRNGTRYALGLRLRELAQPLTDEDSALRATFRPVLRRFAEISGETCYLAVPCGTSEYLCIDSVECDGSLLRATCPCGNREGLTTSAIGKILLANDVGLMRSLRRAGKVSTSLGVELKAIAVQGFALDLEQVEPGLCCVAMPLYKQGRVAAALGMSGPSCRWSSSALQDLVHRMLQEKFGNTKKCD